MTAAHGIALAQRVAVRTLAFLVVTLFFAAPVVAKPGFRKIGNQHGRGKVFELSDGSTTKVWSKVPTSAVVTERNKDGQLQSITFRHERDGMGYAMTTERGPDGKFSPLKATEPGARFVSFGMRDGTEAIKLLIGTSASDTIPVLVARARASGHPIETEVWDQKKVRIEVPKMGETDWQAADRILVSIGAK